MRSQRRPENKLQVRNAVSLALGFLLYMVVQVVDLNRSIIFNMESNYLQKHSILLFETFLIDSDRRHLVVDGNPVSTNFLTEKNMKAHDVNHLNHLPHHKRFYENLPTESKNMARTPKKIEKPKMLSRLNMASQKKRKKRHQRRQIHIAQRKTKPKSKKKNQTIKTKTKLRKEDGRNPIFYNLFVPQENYKNTLLIMKEQMRQRELLAPKAPLYYTLIATENISPEFCEPNCFERAFLKSGHEVDTQQALWEYCQHRPDEWVTYIHDKGSFHDNGNNKKARKIATRAALACRRLLLNRDPKSHDWNVCGASFNILPQFQSNAK